MELRKAAKIWTSAHPKSISILGFAFFSGWMLSVPFEGKTLYALAEIQRIEDIAGLMSKGILFHLLGLISCWFFVRKFGRAKHTIISSVILSLLCSLVFLTDLPHLWAGAQWILSYMSGVIIACWGFWYKSFFLKSERFEAAATLLILSNVLMICSDLFTALLSPIAGLLVSLIFLIATGLCFCFLPIESRGGAEASAFKSKASASSLLKSLIILTLFISLLSINSGIMYSSIMPRFSHLKVLISWYWAIPYIAALFFLRKMFYKSNRFVFLMIGVAMSGVSFLLYSFLDSSALSFLIINTLMLGAFGICDLFWWGTLGEMLDQEYNPALLFGVGLSANVLGILIGRFLVQQDGYFVETEQRTVNLAFIVVLMSIVLLPFLYKYLGVSTEGLSAQKDESNLDLLFELHHIEAAKLSFHKNLTTREVEIVEKLMEGRTYRAISEELYISENTTKYHIKNIYSKLGVHNKTELLHYIQEQSRIEER